MGLSRETGQRLLQSLVVQSEGLAQMIREATNESAHRQQLSESLFRLFHLLFTNASNTEQASLIPALVS